MAVWLHENYRWLIPMVFGGLLIVTGVRWWIERRRFDRDDEEIRRAIERIERRLNES